MRILPLALAALLALPALADDPEPDPAKMPTKPAEAAEEASGAAVIVNYKGAKRQLPKVTRTKEEAKARAEEAVKAARAKGSNFFDVVAKYSDDATARGSLGVIQRGRFPIPAVEAAIFGMEIGQVSEAIDTDIGYLVVARMTAKVAAADILVAWKGAQRALASVTRTKEEAQKLAEEVHKRVTEGKEDFAAVATELSDGPTRTSGGDLGTMGRGMMPPAFEDAAFALAPGEVSGVIETPFGFHVIQGRKIEKPVIYRASHILFAWKGANRAKPTVTRTKEEAKKAAEDMVKRVEAGEDFAKLASENSDCPSRDRGGDLGTFGHGGMAPEFENAVKTLEVGKTSGVVETPFGFHVIKRTN